MRVRLLSRVLPTFAFLLLASLVIAPARLAPAQDAAGTPEYRALVTQAVAEFDAARFEEARALFQRAHDLEPNARTLRGIGMCAFEMRDYVGAVVALESALGDARRPLSDEQRAQVQRLLEQSLLFTGRIRVAVAPLPARIVVDGRPAVQRGDEILVNPGTHEVRVDAEGHAPDVQRLSVPVGEPVLLEVQLAPAVTASAPQAESPAAAPAAPEPTRRRHPVDAPPAIAYGVGGAGLGLFVGFAVRAKRLDSDNGPGCLVAGTCTEADLDAQDRAALIADIALGVGIAGAVTGVLLQMLREGGDDDATVQPVVETEARGVRLGVRAVF